MLSEAKHLARVSARLSLGYVPDALFAVILHALRA
jgi:hypothetical protein